MEEYRLSEGQRRMSVADTVAVWSVERQRRFLLRDGTVPLSVDKRVWPLRNSADALVVTVTALGVDAHSLCVWLGESNLDRFGGAAILFPLGYDICDATLTSGLLNCGYEENERARFSRRWGNRLNRWHLFDDPDDAAEFALVTDARVSEHAPFGVFRLYTAGPLDADVVLPV